MATVDPQHGVRAVHVRIELEDALDLVYIKFLLAVDPDEVPEVWAIIDTRLAQLRQS